MLHHVTKDNPKQWLKLLPHVLWCIRESRNETLGTSPYVMVYGRQPNYPRNILVENWTGVNDLPAALGKPPEQVLVELSRI